MALSEGAPLLQAPVHLLVKKFDFAILIQEMTLSTFLDNLSFDPIERALDSKC